MKYPLTILAACMLSACMGSDDSTTSTMTAPPLPTAPDATLNADFGTLMNDLRMTNNASATALTYDSRVGRAAQLHANDMLTRNYDSIQIPGSDNGAGQPRDIGDRVTDEGYTWADIAQLIEKGDYSLAEALDQFDNVNCDADGTKCIDRTNFVDFGIAKAGSGADQRWVLVLTEPN